MTGHSDQDWLGRPILRQASASPAPESLMIGRVGISQDVL